MEELTETFDVETTTLPLANSTQDDNPASKKVAYKKAPSRQKFDEEINDIKSRIEAKETLVQSLLSNDKNSPQAKLQQLKEKRDTMNLRRRAISTQLEVLNQQITVKRDATSQLRSKLQYQTEAQIDQMVRRLETQLQHHSYRLAEERKLVAEIDKLRRSKKAVKQYNDSKDELQKSRDTQQMLRTERDAISKEFLAQRSQEDTFHSDIRKNREMADTLKKELDELYDQKRNRVAEFKAEQALYHQSRDLRRAEQNRQRIQEKIALAQARSQDREEIRCSIEPYQEERHLCATLLSFLLKLENPTPCTTPSTPASCTSSIAGTPMTPDDARFYLPGCREEPEDGLASGINSLFLGVPKKVSRKAKRSNSRAGANKKRLVPLTPDLLSQFSSLGITAPTSMTEVQGTMEALKAKQKLLTCMANAEMKKEEKLGETVNTSGDVTENNDNDDITPQQPVKLSPQSLSLELPSCTSELPSSLSNGLSSDQL